MKFGKIILACLMAGHISTSSAQSQLLQTMAGNWQFTASNNGKEVAPGVYSAGTDQFSFTATVAADGKSLNCHADCLYQSKQGNEYPADWRIVVEENTEGQHRIGWILTKEQPAFTKEFEEPKDCYLENGFFYWGNGSEANHYIFLLTENEDASAYVATTFWSDWSNVTTTEYALSSTEYNAHKLYAIVASAIPYANSIGYLAIWASIKLKRSNTNGIQKVNTDINAENMVIYNLQGVRMNQLQKGINIVNGRKVVVK